MEVVEYKERKKERKREQARANMRALRAKRAAEGKCRVCESPATTYYCGACKALNRLLGDK